MQWEAQLALRARDFGPEDVELAAREVLVPTRAILHRLLRKDPAERFQTGAELEATLRERLASLVPSYGAEAAAEELLLAKAESRGIVPETVKKSLGVQPEAILVQHEDERTTSES